MKKQDILKMETTGVYYGKICLSVKEIEHDIDDYVICVSYPDWSNPNLNNKTHRVKIYENMNGTFYINVRGIRVPLNEIVRL